MSDDISKVVAMLREPPEEFVLLLHKTFPRSPQDVLTLFADYLDQHARTAPEGEEAHLISEAEAQSIRDTAKRLEAAFGITPEASEPSREELSEALAWALPRALVDLSRQEAAFPIPGMNDKARSEYERACSILSRARMA